MAGNIGYATTDSMGFWPFSWIRKIFTNIGNAKTGVDEEKMAQVPTGDAEKDPDMRGEMPTRVDSKRRRTEKSITVSDSSSSGLKVLTANLTSATATSKSPRHTPVDSARQPEKEQSYQQNAKSSSSIGHLYFNTIEPPTLHAKRRDNNSHLPRRKSSKRKAEDQARERDIRAMSSPIPVSKRSVSYSEGPLRRDTTKVPSRLSRHGDQSASEVSLPIPESLSNMGMGLKQNSFKVNALEVLSPRPTVRYSRNPHSPLPAIESRPITFAQPMAGEGEHSSKKRIEDLADNLDAKALRDLMERDQRRRERKRKTDQARLEQKLKRRAEHEKEQEGRKAAGSQSGKDRDIPAAALSPPAQAVASVDSKGTPADPFSDDNTVEAEPPAPPTLLRPGSSIYTRASQASLSPPTSPVQRAFDRASLSQPSGLHQAATPDLAETTELSRRASEQSSAQLGSWTSFFRRGGTRGKRSSLDRGRHASAEFSNTSRDSVSKSQPQASLVGAPRTFRRSGIPQRTQSKFREDLPELPLSPPDSRVQSPEVGARSRVASASPSEGQVMVDCSTRLANSSSRATFDQIWKDDQLSDSQVDDSQMPPTAALSRSLASVDSEGSWLSGKPAKRSSVQRDQPSRQSQSSSQPPLVESDVREEADVADDPYFSRLSPATLDRRKSSPLSNHRKASSTALNMDVESDLEGESQATTLPDKSEERWHAGLGRQPTLVLQAAQARSKEGLLREYQATDPERGIVEEETSELESPDIEDADLHASSSPIFRAQSVNYGQGHVRRISAGSAKLLDIRRSSVDSSKRQSLPRGERSSTPIRDPAPQEED